MTARMGRAETRREISATLWRRFSRCISIQGSKEESCEASDSGSGAAVRSGAEWRTAGSARPASRNARRECFILADTPDVMRIYQKRENGEQRLEISRGKTSPLKGELQRDGVSQVY